jgi:hypothetical protein
MAGECTRPAVRQLNIQCRVSSELRPRDGSSTATCRRVARGTRCRRWCSSFRRPVRSAGCRSLGGFSLGDRSAQHTIPKYEVRKVHYPWHPRFGRRVHVHGVFHKLGRDLCRCWLPGQEDRIGFQVPAWMLDRAHCALMILRTGPATNLQALLELRQLCNKIVFPSVVTPTELRQATHITNGGNVDGKAQRRPRTGTAQLVRISPKAPSVGGLTDGRSPASHPPSPATAVKQGRPVTPVQRSRRRKR